MVLLPLILKVLLALAVAVPVGVATSDDPQKSQRRERGVIMAATPADWTCIIPYFNEEGVIERCLSSLAGQSPPPNIVLVDNGSTDEGK